MRLPPFGGEGCWLRLIDISRGDDAHRRAGPVASSARSWPAIDSHAAGASSVQRPARRICRWSSPTLPNATGIARSGTLASCSPAPPRFASSRTWSASARSRPGTGWTSVSCSTYPVTPRHSGQKMDGALLASLIVLPHQITADVDVDAYRSLPVGDLLRGAPTGLPSGDTFTAALW